LEEKGITLKNRGKERERRKTGSEHILFACQVFLCKMMAKKKNKTEEIIIYSRKERKAD